LIQGLPSSDGGLALDLTGRKMYWTNSTSNDIRRAHLDGSGQMYWTTYYTGDIRRANLDGSEQQTLLRGLLVPGGIALAISAPSPVAVSGFNADVISDKDPAIRFAQPFGSGTFSWFEAGAVDGGGVEHSNGLPAGLTIVSAASSGATYQIQPGSAVNVLQLSAGQTGTLTLTTPAAFSKLYVIASSGDGTSSSVGSGTINYADGSTQAFGYNSFDWCILASAQRPVRVRR
jgi:hypothetical protein